MSTAAERIAERRITFAKSFRFQGISFASMVPLLRGMRLLGCQNCDDPAFQRSTRDGETICETCENTLNQDWRRYLERLGVELEKADVKQIKGAWMYAHDFIEQVCIENHIVEAEVITTRTEIVDGKEIKHTTTRKERRVNVTLLRLLSDVHDKRLKLAGIDIDDPERADPPPRKKMHIHARADDDRGEPAN